MRKIPLAMLVALVASLTLAGTAAAQTARSTEGFRLTPYLWNAGFKGTLGVGNGGGGRVDVGFPNLVDNLETGGFMLYGEWRKGPFSIFGDITLVKVTSSAPSPLGALYSGVAGTIDGEILQLAVGYRISGDASPGLEVFLGERSYSLKGELALQPGLAAGNTLARRKDWEDQIAGLRWRRALTGNWIATLYGDVGAGGSDATWQAIASLGYETGWGGVIAGWRHLYVDYDTAELKIDAALGGPFLGVTIRF